jgi:hypothetical protein
MFNSIDKGDSVPKYGTQNTTVSVSSFEELSKQSSCFFCLSLMFASYRRRSISIFVADGVNMPISANELMSCLRDVLSTCLCFSVETDRHFVSF